MAENGFFKTAFRGFRKEDVLEYIDSLNTAHCEEAASLTQELAALCKQKEALEQKLPSLEQEIEMLRVRAGEAEKAKSDLEDAKRQLVILGEENRQQKERISALEETATQYTRLKHENEVLNQQLASQQTQLDTFEKMFGDSRDAVSFVRENVETRLQETNRRTERTLTEVEQLVSRMAAELEEMRSRTAALRNEAMLADEKDAAALSEWFKQFDKKVEAPTATHFFR